MGVDAIHPDVRKMLPIWEKCEDAIEGEEAVKAKGTEYLPSLGSHRVDSPLAASSSKYEAYKERAMYYNAPGRTAVGLAGLLLTKRPTVEIPDQFDLNQVSKEGQSWDQFVADLVDDVIQTRAVHLVDATPDGQVTVVEYDADDLINFSHAVIDGVRTPVLAVLRESAPKPGSDEFDHETVEQLRVLRLRQMVVGAPPVYTQQVYVKRVTDDGGKRTETWEPGPEIIPQRVGGSPLDFIPLQAYNPMSLEWEPERPLLADLVNVALSHYRNSADLEHGRHWTALPTAVAVGFPTRDPITGEAIQLAVGSEAAWVTDAQGANAFYLEFSGAGLGHIAEGMKDKQSIMAVQGARLLEEPKAAVESAETLRVRKSSERSVLARVALTLSEGLTQVLRWWAQWQNPTIEDDEVSVEFESEFVDPTLTAQDISAIVAAAQAGLISFATAFWNLHRGKIIPEARTLEEEGALISEGLPAGAAPLPAPFPAVSGESPLETR